MRVLIVGISTRAAAESAARAGFDVVAIDAFGDLDQHPSVRSLSLPRDFGTPFTPRALVRAASTIATDALVYLSTLENHPRTVTALSRGRELWGNASDVLMRVRDPFLLEQVLRRRGFAVPAAFRRDTDSPSTGVLGEASDRRLMKPLASGGGQRVRTWLTGRRLPRGCYGQRFVPGTPGSVVFVSARGRAVPLAVSRQIVGDPSFGAIGFRYCGSILTRSSGPGAECDCRLADEASALAAAVSEEFGLVGVAGIDFVIDDGRPCVLEVNPRWCASMELVERAYGMSVFAAHAAACRDGALPSFDLTRARDGSRAYGKAIVFARQDLVAGDTRPWLEDPSVRDVPRPRDRISRGQPVCTVFADATDEHACHAALVRRAERIYAELDCYSYAHG
jgi:predicted ATP-grasp superfamily ATP-dependent carboligase